MTERKLAAILSADVVGYSRLMADDEAATVETIQQYRASIGRVIDLHKGRIVNAPGDNNLAEFASAVEAVQAAVEIQRAIEGRNVELPEDRRMQFRVGVNLGDVIQEEDGTIYGDGVNIAARMEALAETGGIFIHPYNHPDIIAGQGTVALELIDQVPGLDAIMAPVGGGGLLSGICIATKGLSPQCLIFAAEPAGADDTVARALDAKGNPVIREIRAKEKAEGKIEGLTEGEIKGKAEAILTVLAGRGLSPGAAVRRRILGTTDLATLERWLLKAGTVSSPEEVVED